MKNIKKLFSVLFSAILLFSATTTSSVAIDKLHFVIGGGAGGGWDGTARGTGEALTKAGFLKSASFENMSGGGGFLMKNTSLSNTESFFRSISCAYDIQNSMLCNSEHWSG